MKTMTAIGGLAAAALMATGLGVTAQANQTQNAVPTTATNHAAPGPSNKCLSKTTRGGGYTRATLVNEGGWGRAALVETSPSIRIGTRTYMRTEIRRTVGKNTKVWRENGAYDEGMSRDGWLTYIPVNKTSKGTVTRISTKYASGHTTICDLATWLTP